MQGEHKLQTHPAREGGANHGATGFYVRAIGTSGSWGTFDLAELDRDSAARWLQFKSGEAQVGVFVALALLGHDHAEALPPAGSAGADSELLDGLEAATRRGCCPALIYDDAGHWAVATEGVQQVLVSEEAQAISTTFWVPAELWRGSAREAIRDFLDKEDDAHEREADAAGDAV